jgi:hypothetical protein
MSRSAPLQLLAFVVLVAATASVVFPDRTDVTLAASAVFLLAAASTAAVVRAWRARSSAPSPFASLESEALAPERPDDLVRLERMLGWKVYSRAEFGARVAPALARALGARVKKRFGVDVAAEPDRARGLIDQELWVLVDRSHLEPGDAPLDTDAIARLVDLIEAV